MSLTEFQIIERYFTKPALSRTVVKSVGDDAAVVAIPVGYEWVTSVDTLVESVHFPRETSAEDIGYKALAVNLSDLAAMGAEPVSALLAITLPKADEHWLESFARGFFSLAEQSRVDLIGGDATRGPLCISVVANGIVPEGKSLFRSGAKAGDLIYVTGTVGDAGLALELIRSKKPVSDYLLQRLNRPSPRVKEGICLREFATSMIDISDGLVADLEKLLLASRVGARVSADRLPLSSELRKQGEKRAWEYALTSGDDYELCFTVPNAKSTALEKAFSSFDCGLSCVGEITSQRELVIIDRNNKPIAMKNKGYEHFTEEK